MLLLTGYRCLTGEGATVVDAAQIEAWADTQNDDLTNGLALLKNAHWMFDDGLWSADDPRILTAAHRFTENGPEAIKLAAFAGRHSRFSLRASSLICPAHGENLCRHQTDGSRWRHWPIRDRRCRRFDLLAGAHHREGH